MSEKHSPKFENIETSTQRHEQPVEKPLDTIGNDQIEARQSQQMEAARQEVAKISAEKEEVLTKLNEKQTFEASDQEIDQRPVGKELKQVTFNKEISHIRRKLGPVDRLTSKVIHQPIVRNASEVSSKTITRPSGLLGGGITAFLGTSIYLYLTKHIGLKYNYSMFLFLLIAGFILGIAIEAVIRLVRGRRTV